MYKAIINIEKTQYWAMFSIIPVLVVVSFAVAAQETSKGVRCVLDVSSKEIFPFEPLYLMISLKNETDKGVEVEVLRQPLARIGVLDQGRIQWSDPFSGGLLQGPPPRPEKVELAPNERLTLMRAVHYDAPLPRRALIQKPGVAYMQGIIYADDRKFESEPIKVTILQPQGADAEAYDYLRTKSKELAAIALPPGLRRDLERSGNTLPDIGLYELFYEETIYGWDWENEQIEELMKFAARFPNSRYARYARLGAGLIRLYTRNELRDLQQAANLFQEVARNADDTLAARAYYYSGKTAEEQGNLAEADQNYTRSLSLKGDPYFKSLAEQAQIKVKRRLSSKQ